MKSSFDYVDIDSTDKAEDALREAMIRRAIALIDEALLQWHPYCNMRVVWEICIRGIDCPPVPAARRTFGGEAVVWFCVAAIFCWEILKWLVQ